MSRGRPAPSIGAELRRAASEAPDATCWIHDGSSTSFRQVWAEVRATAAALVRLGVEPEDRIVVWAANDRSTAVALLAVATAGATIIPINTRYTAPEVAAIVARTSPALVMAPARVADRQIARDALAVAGGVRVICIGPGGPAGTLHWETFLDGEDPASLAAVDARVDDMTGDEIVITQFTSGTTGRPKGAMLRQGPLLLSSAAWADITGLHGDDVYPVLYPLAHIGGFKTGLVTNLVARTTAVLVDTVDRDSVVATMNDHPISVLNAPPAVLRTLLEAAEEGRLRPTAALRTIVTGSAAVPPQLVRDLRTALGVDDVVIAYGVTEASGACLMTRRGDSVALASETLGRAIPGVEVRTRGATDGRPRPIEVRSDYLMLGYLDDPDASAEALHDGWLDTGDLGWTDRHGYVHLAGRSTDMIVVGGFNVYPAEVEHVLVEHPDVVEAAAVGTNHDRLGEVPVAFVVLRAESSVTSQDLVEYARTRLASYKVPRRVWIVPGLPRNAVAKVERVTLRERAATLTTPGEQRRRPVDVTPSGPPLR